MSYNIRIDMKFVAKLFVANNYLPSINVDGYHYSYHEENIVPSYYLVTCTRFMVGGAECFERWTY